MKIGVLTFHNIPNIGALLQAYSLCVALRKKGVECELIDYTCPNIRRRELESPRTGNKLKDILIRFLIWPKTKKKIKACQQFMFERKLYSNRQYQRSSLKETEMDYDAFITGSDMVWNLSLTDHDWSYFCDFISDSKKAYSYGSSIGDVWENNDLERIVTLLSRYRMIRVRETDTCSTLNALGIDAELVSDPTMLLSVQEWESIAKLPKEKDYVLVYFPTEKNMREARKYASECGKEIFVLNWGMPIKGYRNIAPLSPDEWIGFFINASAIFTGSYHGLLFSLYFEKPVWTDNESNRVSSLLSKFKIERCLIKDNSNIIFNIDYHKVSKDIDIFRSVSLHYLDQIIEDCKL